MNTGRYSGQFSLGDDIGAPRGVPKSGSKFGNMSSRPVLEEEAFTPEMPAPPKESFGDGKISNTEATVAGIGIDTAVTLGSGLAELGSSKKDKKAQEAAKAKFDAEEALNKAERKRQQRIADEYNKQLQDLEDEKLSYFERMQDASIEFEKMMEAAEQEELSMLKFKSSGKMQRSFAQSKMDQFDRQPME